MHTLSHYICIHICTSIDPSTHTHSHAWCIHASINRFIHPCIHAYIHPCIIPECKHKSICFQECMYPYHTDTFCMYQGRCIHCIHGTVCTHCVHSTQWVQRIQCLSINCMQVPRPAIDHMTTTIATATAIAEAIAIAILITIITATWSSRSKVSSNPKAFEFIIWSFGRHLILNKGFV